MPADGEGETAARGWVEMVLSAARVPAESHQPALECVTYWRARQPVTAAPRRSSNILRG